MLYRQSPLYISFRSFAASLCAVRVVCSTKYERRPTIDAHRELFETGYNMWAKIPNKIIINKRNEKKQRKKKYRRLRKQTNKTVRGIVVLNTGTQDGGGECRKWNLNIFKFSFWSTRCQMVKAINAVARMHSPNNATKLKRILAQGLRKHCRHFGREQQPSRRSFLRSKYHTFGSVCTSFPCCNCLTRIRRTMFFRHQMAHSFVNYLGRHCRRVNCIKSGEQHIAHQFKYRWHLTAFRSHRSIIIDARAPRAREREEDWKSKSIDPVKFLFNPNATRLSSMHRPNNIKNKTCKRLFSFYSGVTERLPYVRRSNEKYPISPAARRVTN